ncbi:MAG: glutamine--tRNA ligase/YqeY domain fusion protein [Phycisphaerales bacterium]|nr:glutamine--tRNA ligase/YqeY domain fusion protein [Phycisphaerales bacterium]
MPDTPDKPRHFIRQIIDDDMRSGRWGGRVHTRFPPEPNGYLHVGHAKSICLNFGLAREYDGRFNLRFDDTNPLKEEMEFVEGIKRDVLWLGADWTGPHGGGIFWSSDYFQRMFEFAVELVKKGRAYVCDLTAEQTRAYRGTLTEPGRPSPFRDRSVEENLDLLDRMRRGEFPDGSRTLRAKIDMASPNLNLRDPVMYRILHATHHNTGDAWCIYPMYDWAHGLEDSIEGITHSICTLEFENHRPLYDWFIDAINEGRTEDGSGPWGRRIPHPQQIEFAKLALTTVLLSKRNLRRLVEEGRVAGWDDPRMPTICAMRRRGYTPESLWDLCERVGVTKYNSTTEVVMLENAVRDHLNRVAPRRMGVLRPLRVVITNWSDGGDADRVEWMDAVNNPEDRAAGTRRVPFTRELFVERDDFMEDPPKGFFRLAPGVEVRLRYAYWITCREVVKDATGEIVELRCTYDPATRGGESPPPGPDGRVRKVKATLHWVSATHARRAEVRLFDRLFAADEPGKRTGDPIDDLHPNSLETLHDAAVEPALVERASDEPAWPDGIRRFQFERLGYFCVDRDSTPDRPVFNRTVTLKDTWAKVAAKGG